MVLFYIGILGEVSHWLVKLFKNLCDLASESDDPYATYSDTDYISDTWPETKENKTVGLGDEDSHIQDIHDIYSLSDDDLEEESEQERVT